MSLYAISLLACGLLVLAMPLCARLGHRTGRRLLQSSPDAKELSTGTVDAAILSLLGLLTAFTFSSAYSRFELRRQLIVDEVNAIGTAYLRVDLLPAEIQPSVRAKFREYAKSRYEMWQLFAHRQAALEENDREAALQKAIWNEVIQSTATEQQGDARKLLLPALNEMIDITTTRLVAVQSHPPLLIFLLLGGLSLSAAWIIGFGMAKATHMSYSHVFGFSIIASLALYMILDIEFPRWGVVTLDQPHQLFLQLMASMQ